MAILLAVMKLLPMIIAGVQALEVAIPFPGAGKAKLDLILGTVNDVYNADQAIQKELSSSQLVSVVTSTVSRIVACFNALGIFKNKAK